MRILRIADVPNNRTGGMSRMMHFTSEHLRGQGHEVHFLFAEDLASWFGGRLRRLALPWSLPGIVRRSMRQSGAFDVVEIHEPLSMGYALARIAGLSLPPLVALSHGVEARSRQTALAYRSQRRLPVTFRERWLPVTVWQANRGLRHADAIVCLNSEDEEYLQARGVPRQRVFRVANGIEDRFLISGAQRLLGGPGKRMLFCGSWLERKGILDLVPAVVMAFGQCPEASLTVAGCGASEGQVRQCFPHSVQTRVHVIPKVVPDELISLYARHDIFLLPSYFEGFPLVMLEAAALKLAIVACETCGMKDFIQDGEVGLLAPPGNPEVLARRMLEVLQDPQHCKALGEAAHQKAQSFTWEATAHGLLTAYESACAIPSGRESRQPAVRIG